MDKLVFLVIVSALVILFGTVVMYAVESGHPDSEIDSWLNAAWWTVATVTTVGYGDIVPVTDAGRIIAIFYMFFGIAILGVSLSVLGTRYYKKKFEDTKEISHGNKMILDKIENLEKHQEKLQKDLGDLIDKLKDDSNNNLK